MRLRRLWSEALRIHAAPKGEQGGVGAGREDVGAT